MDLVVAVLSVIANLYQRREQSDPNIRAGDEMTHSEIPNVINTWNRYVLSAPADREHADLHPAYELEFVRAALFKDNPIGEEVRDRLDSYIRESLSPTITTMFRTVWEGAHGIAMGTVLSFNYPAVVCSLLSYVQKIQGAPRVAIGNSRVRLNGIKTNIMQNITEITTKLS